jgi:hypothetical protein
MGKGMRTLTLALGLLCIVAAVAGASSHIPQSQDSAPSIYVAANGNDETGDGSVALPYRTMNHAAQLAVAGDMVIIRGGVYREMVKPVNGGTSDLSRITYQALRPIISATSP